MVNTIKSIQNAAAVLLLSSMALCQQSVTCTNTSWVECWGQNPDCLSDSKLSFNKKEINWSWATLSKALEKQKLLLTTLGLLYWSNYSMLPKLRKCASGNTVVYNSSNKSSERPDRNIISTRCFFSIQTRNNWSIKFFRNIVEVKCLCSRSNKRKWGKQM